MSEPRYPTVHVHVGAVEADQVSAELFELGATGVETRDQTTMDRSEADVELVAHFPDEPGARAAVAALGEARARVDFIVGDAWKERWKEFFRPTRVGERFIVRPPWESVDRRDEDRVITIDPGMAFGTGTHETTRLVLMEIEHLDPSGTVLDVGCGSGILSIAALLCGATSAVAVDIDPIAARVSLENAEVNGVSLEASTTPVEAVEGDFDLVLANIRSPILIPMAEALRARTRGVLVLSGLLLDERQEVRDAFDPLLTFERERVEGEWLSLTYAVGA